MELLQHQVEGIARLKASPRMLLADEPGLGKTVQMLKSAVEPVLVLAPAMVLDSGTWDDEIAKWSPGIDLTQVSYSSLCVRGEHGRVERDSNGMPRVEVKPEYAQRWGTVLCDESHHLCNPKSSYTAGVFKLKADRLDLATGTPIPNWASEAFTALQLLYPEDAKPGKRLGSYWRWAREWFDVGPTMWAQQAVGDLQDDTDEGWARFREGNWGDRMLLRLRENCLDLPPLTQQKWLVKMKSEQRRAYRELEKDFITWLDTGDEISAWSSAAQMVKLWKCATGLESLGTGARGSGKLDALRSILTDRPRQTLVVAHFRSSVETCARAAVQVGRTAVVVHGGTDRPGRREAIRAFQSGGVDVMVASIETIAEGMTLHQGGADTVVRVERTMRPSKNEQVLRRLHRMGVERPILAIDLVAEGTIDERMLEYLQTKTDQQVKALGLDELRRLGGRR